ncbi:MAG: hypothetical protein QXO69_01130 [archaeon]
MAVVEVRSCDVWTAGKIGAALGFIWGAIAGLVRAVAGGTLFGSSVLGIQGYSAAGIVGFFVIWMAAIAVYTTTGLVGGMLASLMYNFAASRIGGIKLKIKTKE